MRVMLLDEVLACRKINNYVLVYNWCGGSAQFTKLVGNGDEIKELILGRVLGNKYSRPLQANLPARKCLDAYQKMRDNKGIPGYKV